MLLVFGVDVPKLTAVSVLKFRAIMFNIMRHFYVITNIFFNLDEQVACLRCHQESERYENIMDLTLEIFGWVESLEDALTQFTTPEDLDGENMYRCGRFDKISLLMVWML